jgi:hypothetical protein
MPVSFRAVLGPQLGGAVFPDGTLVMGCLATGWFWPALVVGIRLFQRLLRKGGAEGADHSRNA